MFGIPIEGPYHMLYDNKSVYKTVSNSELTLKKKNVSICYHKCKEAVAAKVDRISKEGTATNFIDMVTKMLVQIRRETFLDKFMY